MELKMALVQNLSKMNVQGGHSNQAGITSQFCSLMYKENRETLPQIQSPNGKTCIVKILC